MAKRSGCFFIVLFLLLQFPQELAAQDFFPRLFRTGKFSRYSCGKMDAYNQRAAYRKHKKSFLKKMFAKSTAKTPANETVARTNTTEKKPGAPQTSISKTTKTKSPGPKPSGSTPPVHKPGPGTSTAPPLAKAQPKAPQRVDSAALVKKEVRQLTRQELKKMTLQQRRDTLENMPPEIVLPPIQFISDQDEFSVVNMDSFMQAMEYAQQGKVVLVEGHTDDLGSDSYNLKLSMKRAEKIRQLLLSGNVSDELISVIGYGESKPVVPNTSAENRAINRRIEFKIFSLPN